MTKRPDWEIDRVLLRYADALDVEDWQTFNEVWRQAETDRELEAALHELHRGMLEEYGGAAGRAEDAAAVRRLVQEHFAERPADGENLEQPLTAGDVAVRLQADVAAGAVRLIESDRAANAQLVGNPALLPEPLKQSVLEPWCAMLGVTASKEYWRQFRQAAVRLAMTRSHQRMRLAAAREQTPPRKTKDDRRE